MPFPIYAWLPTHKIEGTSRYVCIAYAAQGRKGRAEIFVYDADANRAVASFGFFATYPVISPMPERGEFAISGDMAEKGSGDQDRIEIFDLHTFEHRRTLDLPGRALAYLPRFDTLVAKGTDGRRLLVSPTDGSVAGVLLVEHPKSDGTPRITFGSNMLNDEMVLATGPRPFRPVLIDTLEPESGLKPTLTARPHPGHIYNIAVSPGGGLIATYHYFENTLCVLDARTGESLWTSVLETPASTRELAQLYFDAASTLVTSIGLSEHGNSAIVERPLLTGSPRISTLPHNTEGFAERDLEGLRPGQQLSSRASVHPDGDGFVLNRTRVEGRLIHIQRDGDGRGLRDQPRRRAHRDRRGVRVSIAGRLMSSPP